jgi:two-component sensor histidine kinase
LIINELVANAFKHAFPDASSGSIDISLRGHEGGECILEVADNGRGLNDPFDQERSETLGLNLVKTLASQLGGEVAVEGDSGLRISIRFRQQQTPNLLAS